MTIDTFRAYTDYDPLHPPEHPGQRWTRFVCISDTHSGRFPVPPGDILLHAGDLSSWGQVHQLQVWDSVDNSKLSLIMNLSDYYRMACESPTPAQDVLFSSSLSSEQN